MSSRKIATVLLVLGAVASLASCSEEGAGVTNSVPGDPQAEASATSTSGTRPTLTDSKLQPPAQENDYTTEGRPEVVFDPCTWISDAAVREAGLDPATRRRGEDIVAEYTFLTCDFKGGDRDLSIDSGNVTWEEDLQKNGPNSEPLTVNGREAIWVRDPDLVGTCDIHVRTEVGFVIFSATRTFEGADSGLSRCDGVLQIATALEPEIGTEN